MKNAILAVACGAILLLSAPANATPISGQLFTTAGFTVTATSLLFCASPAIPCPNTATGTFDTTDSGTGSFAAPYANDPSGVTVTNLNNVNAPVGTLLPGNGIVFMTFNPSAALPTPDIQLWLTELFAGVGGTANCGAVAAPGQTCTPTGSAVTFLNTATGSSATIDALGKAERISTLEFDTLHLEFTTQFNVPFQTVLAQFAATGSFSATESGTFSASAVPEPMTLSLMSIGLLGFGLLGRRRTAKK